MAKTKSPLPAAQGAAGEYPKAKYRSVPVSQKHPNGYEARQVADADAEGLLNPDVWKDSPDELGKPRAARPPTPANA